MAVEIPVVIDIEQAFRDAANRVPGALQPMQRAIDENALEVIVQINRKGDIAEVLDFVGKTKRTVGDLNFAIKSASTELARLKRIGASQQDIDAYTRAVAVLKDVRYQWKLNEQEANRVGDAEIRNAEMARLWAESTALVSNTISNINTKIAGYTQVINSSDIGSQKFREAAIALGEMSRKLEAAQLQVKALGTTSGSIDNLNAKLQILNQRWSTMAANQKFAGPGRLTAEGRNLYQQYKQVTSEIKRFGMSLSDIASKEAARAQKHQQIIDQRKKENAILNATTRSIDDLTAKVSVLTARLNKTPIGTQKFAELNMQLRQTQVELKKVQAGVSTIGAESNRAGISMGRMFSRMGALFGLHLFTSFIRNIRQVTAEFELQKVALGGIIQDTDRAASLFRQLKAAAIESPFEIKELVSYTKQLSAYRVETENLFDVTMRLADVSAGLGVDMGRLILAYGQVRAASVLRGQELRQFTEAGIPLVDLLAKKFQELNGRMVSTAEVFDLISKRAVPFEMISSIFEDMTDKGGIFYKMQEKQAETLAGQWSNLKDALSIMYDEMGNTEAVHKAMEDLIGSAKTLMVNWRTITNILGATIKSFLTLKLVTLFLPTLTYNTKLAEKATTALARAQEMETINSTKANLARKLAIKNLQTYAKYMQRAAVAQSKFGRGLNQLAAGFLGGGWIGTATLAIGVLVGVISSAIKNANKLKNDLEEIDIEGRTSINRTASNFNRLAQSAVDAADGSKEQVKALEELKRTYSDIIPSQDLQIEKLRALAGDYSSLTRAIEEKINMQTRENKLNAAQDYFANKITKRRKEAKDFLEDQIGLEAMQANAIFDRINEEVKKGTITPGRYAFKENKDIFLDIIREMTGVTVLYSNAYKDYEGNIRTLKGSTSELINLLLGVSDIYSDLNDVQQRINDEMSDSTGTMGVYAKNWENLQETLRQVSVDTEKFGNEFTFAHKKERMRQQVEILAGAIEDAFKNTGIDISDAIKANEIDFNFLGEQAAKTNRWGLKGYIKNIQDSYEAIVPTNKMVGVVERKFQEIASQVGLSMDDVQGYLLRGEKDIRAYTEEVQDDLQKAKDKINEYAQINEDASKYKVALPVPDETLDKANKLVQFLELLLQYLDVYAKHKKGSAQQDPFIIQMQNRIKFMKDFQKGYEDLNTYLDSSDALKKQAEIMQGRGESLGLSSSEQKRAATDLSGWYSDMIDKVKARMQARGFRGVTVQDLLGIQISENNKEAKALQQLLQQLWDAKTDYDVSQQKKNLEKALQTLADEVKRSETAKNFFNDILGLTGDEQMAMSMSMSIYGDAGDNLREQIQEQLRDSFVIEPEFLKADNLDLETVRGEIDKAIASGDYGALEKYLKYVEEKYRNTAAEIVHNWQKQNAEVAKGYDKLLLKYDEMERRRIDVTQKAANDRKTLQKGLNLEIAGLQKQAAKELEGVSDPQERQRITERYNKLIAEARARAAGAVEAVDREENLELYKLSNEYRMFFSSINVLSEKTARAIRSNVRQQLVEQYLAGDITLEQFERSLNELDQRYKKYEDRKGFLYTYLTGGVQGAIDMKRQIADDLKAVAKEISLADSVWDVPEESKDFLDRVAKLYGADLFGVKGKENVFASVAEKVELSTKKMGEAIIEASEALSESASKSSQGWGWAAFWVTNVSTLIQELNAFNTELDEASPGWLDALASMVTWTLGRTDDAWDRLSALNEKATSGFQKFQQGNIVGAIADNVRGLIDFWGPNIRRINARIEDQQHLIDELSYSYDRLRDAENGAFGADFISNYNARLQALQAQQAAYERQARLERDKGKSKDKEKIRDYEKSAREVADQIADMRSEVAERFLGTDLASAARDFASSWLDAYKEFSSTTDAIKEKFADMIQNMVVESLGAQLVERQLDPIFREINRLAEEGGELSAMDASIIAEKANQAVTGINTDLTNLMNALASVGLSTRTMGTGLTGIAKDIQGASEESILGLAAGVNTQNFYLQQIHTNVLAILAKMQAPTDAAGVPAAEVPYVNGPEFMGRMESLDRNLATLLQRMDSIITPKNASTNTHCIAIK